MRRFFCLLIFLFLLGCQPDESSDFQYQEEEFTDQAEQPKAAEPTSSEVEPAKETLPAKGVIEFSSEVKTTVSVLDETADVDMKTSGKINYEIDDRNIVKGSGDGEVKVSLKSDIGLAVCKGSKKIPIEFSVAGIRDPKSGEIIFKSHDVKPKSDSLTLTCPSDFGDLTYELVIPVLTFVGQGTEGEVILDLKEPVTKVITHTVPDWDVPLEATWKFNLVTPEVVVFDVDVDPPVVTIDQGSTATPSVTVRLIAGRGDVSLKNTQWPNINAFIVNKIVTPTETTTLTIETTCDTEPDEYLFTVTGETSGTFETSVDSVNVVVTKNPSCP